MTTGACGGTGLHAPVIFALSPVSRRRGGTERRIPFMCLLCTP